MPSPYAFCMHAAAYLIVGVQPGSAAGNAMADSDAILDTVRRYWGYDTLRPMQEEAIGAGLARRDALVVLPTGGGKSLCYQVPPAVTGRTDVVVSPLIALMKEWDPLESTCRHASLSIL